MGLTSRGSLPKSGDCCWLCSGRDVVEPPFRRMWDLCLVAVTVGFWINAGIEVDIMMSYGPRTRVRPWDPEQGARGRGSLTSLGHARQ